MKKDGIFDSPVRGKIRLGYGAEAMDGSRERSPAADMGGSQPAFSCRCKRSPKGKVLEKIETGPMGRNVFSFEYDAAGHLAVVRRNEVLSEYYYYLEHNLSCDK